VLFNVYINSVLLRLQQSNYGCVIGSQFLGCIVYADDLLLLCPSICGLRKMLNICMEEFSDLHLTLNVNKSCILRFGARYMHNCKEVQFDDGAIGLHCPSLRSEQPASGQAVGVSSYSLPFY